MLALYGSAFLFGITVAIAIGPIALLILRAGIEQGFGTAARCALGAATADLLYALVAFIAGAATIARLEPHRALIERGGAVLLIALGLWLASTAVRGARPRAAGATQEQSSLPAAGTRGLGYVSTLLLTLVNPLTVVIFLSFASQLGGAPGLLAVIGSAVAVFAGSLLVQLALAGSGAILHRSIRSPRVLLALNLASGLGIAGFGLAGLARGLEAGS